MIAPSADDMEKLYPLEEWNRDLCLWFSRGRLSAGELPQVVAYYHKEQASNPGRDENAGRMWMTLAFLQAFLPDLVRGGAAIVSPSGEKVLPPS